jgi:hypothetical protein
MIREIIDLLKTEDFYGVDPIIDIAKGKYKTPTKIKELKESVKRRING